MSVRAKFKCNSLEVYEFTTKVNLSPVLYNEFSDENTSFNEATPSGALWMNIDNPKAAITFIPGKEYYLDFTEID